MHDTEHGSTEKSADSRSSVKQYRHGSSEVVVDKSPARLSSQRLFVSEAHTATSFCQRMVNAHAIRRGPASPIALCVQVLRSRLCKCPGGQSAREQRDKELGRIWCVGAPDLAGPMHCPNDVAGCGSWRIAWPWTGEL
jgi:hypothetical protein